MRRTPSDRRSSSLIGGLAAAISCGTATAQCTYVIEAIIESPLATAGTPEPNDLNNRGHLCGIYAPGPGAPQRAWYWTPKLGFVDLGLGPDSYANGINELDQIGGSVMPAPQQGYRPFRWDAGQLEVLTPLPPFPPPKTGVPSSGVGREIDGSGRVIGTWGMNGLPQVACYRWLPGTSFDPIEELLEFGAVDARDVNSQGWIAGWCKTSPDEQGVVIKRAFRLIGSELTVLPPVPFGYTSEAHGISSNGYVVGWGLYNYEPTGQQFPRAFFWDGSAMHDIGWSPGGTPRSFGLAVNALGQVVGSMNGNTGYLWQNGQLHALGDLTEGVTGVNIVSAINDRGQIATKTNQIGGVGLLLSPLRTRSGDANIDCAVDAKDLAIIFEFWGESYDLDGMPGDLNGDLLVDAYDLAMVLGDWGPRREDGGKR